jgi:hypothetical protein
MNTTPPTSDPGSSLSGRSKPSAQFDPGWSTNKLNDLYDILDRLYLANPTDGNNQGYVRRATRKANVAISCTFGPAKLLSFAVVTDEIGGAGAV